MIDPTVASIVIAVIGMAGGVWAAYISNHNQKATKNITAVLANTKTPVDSLDQVIRVLQEELAQALKRHDKERQFFTQEINRLRDDNTLDRKNWERERVLLLEQIEQLRKQLGTLEDRVRVGLSGQPKKENGV